MSSINIGGNTNLVTKKQAKDFRAKIEYNYSPQCRWSLDENVWQPYGRVGHGGRDDRMPNLGTRRIQAIKRFVSHSKAALKIKYSNKEHLQELFTWRECESKVIADAPHELKRRATSWLYISALTFTKHSFHPERNKNHQNNHKQYVDNTRNQGE